MTAPWTAEREVGPALATQLLSQQFADLTITSLTLLGAGWDNTAYLVNGTHVVRFPRRTLAVDLLVAERTLLPWISREVSLPIPVPVWLGRPSDDYPWPFVGYRLLPGETACRAHVTADERLRMAPDFGRWLSQLHGLDVDRARALGAGGDTLGRLDLGRLRQVITDNAAHVHEVDRALVDAVLEDTRILPPVHDATLVHGDLYARHLLIDDRRQLCGVIDWGDVHVGARAVDLSVVWTFFPPHARARFVEGYGVPVDETTWRQARVRGLHSALTIVRYAVSTGDEALLREGRLALEHLRTG